jgi:hypothetical protein
MEPPAPEPEAEVPDVFTCPGPTVFAKTRLPLNINATEIVRIDTACETAFIAVSLFVPDQSR